MNPKVLREDPLMGIEYMRIITLIRKKVLLEYTGDTYDGTQIKELHHFDEDTELEK
jgi:hypothetical protein